MATNVDPAVRAEWFKDMFVGPDMFDWALNVLVLRSGDKTILFDAGLGVQFPGLPRAGQFHKRLPAAGIDFASRPDIILTPRPLHNIGGTPIHERTGRLDPAGSSHVHAHAIAIWTNTDVRH